MLTIFASVCTFLIAQKTSIASSVIARGTYDILKGSLNLQSMQNKISSYFKDNTQTENFVEALCNTDAINVHKPFRDVEDKYEELTGNTYNTGLADEITKWVKENESQIESVAQVTLTNNTGITVGVQNAGKNVYNIGGDFKPTSKSQENGNK